MKISCCLVALFFYFSLFEDLGRAESHTRKRRHDTPPIEGLISIHDIPRPPLHTLDADSEEEKAEDIFEEIVDEAIHGDDKRSHLSQMGRKRSEDPDFDDDENNDDFDIDEDYYDESDVKFEDFKRSFLQYTGKRFLKDDKRSHLSQMGRKRSEETDFDDDENNDDFDIDEDYDESDDKFEDVKRSFLRYTGKRAAKKRSLENKRSHLSQMGRKRSEDTDFDDDENNDDFDIDEDYDESDDKFEDVKRSFLQYTGKRAAKKRSLEEDKRSHLSQMGRKRSEDTDFDDDENNDDFDIDEDYDESDDNFEDVKRSFLQYTGKRAAKKSFLTATGKRSFQKEVGERNDQDVGEKRLPEYFKRFAMHEDFAKALEELQNSVRKRFDVGIPGKKSHQPVFPGRFESAKRAEPLEAMEDPVMHVL